MSFSEYPFSRDRSALKMRIEEFSWGAALILWGLGDLITTFISMHYGFGVESTVVVNAIIQNVGHLGHVGFKMTIFAIFLVIWKTLPMPYRMAVPIGFSAAGGILTVNNLNVILAGL
jgi:hypothetical protein